MGIGVFDKVIILGGDGTVTDLAQDKLTVMGRIGLKTLQDAGAELSDEGLAKVRSWLNQKGNHRLVQHRNRLTGERDILTCLTDAQSIVAGHQPFFGRDEITASFGVIRDQIALIDSAMASQKKHIPIDPRLSNALELARACLMEDPSLYPAGVAFYDTITNTPKVLDGKTRAASERKELLTACVQESEGTTMLVDCLREAFVAASFNDFIAETRGARGDIKISRILQDAKDMTTDLMVVSSICGLYAAARLSGKGAAAASALENIRAEIHSLEEAIVGKLKEHLQPTTFEEISTPVQSRETPKVVEVPIKDPELEAMNRQLVTEFVTDKFPGIGEQRSDELIEYFCSKADIQELETRYRECLGIFSDRGTTEQLRLLSLHPELLLLETYGKRVSGIKNILH